MRHDRLSALRRRSTGRDERDAGYRTCNQTIPFHVDTGEDKFQACPLKFGDEHQRDTISTRNLDRPWIIELAVFVQCDFNESFLAADFGRNCEHHCTELRDNHVFRPIAGPKVIELVGMLPRSLNSLVLSLSLALHYSVCEDDVG